MCTFSEDINPLLLFYSIEYWYPIVLFYIE